MIRRRDVERVGKSPFVDGDEMVAGEDRQCKTRRDHLVADEDDAGAGATVGALSEDVVGRRGC